MDNLEEKLEIKLKYLYKMLEKYNVLNNKTKNKFDWRERAIDDQISILEDLKNNKNTDWDTCYLEDLNE
ncbi:hypothetical protein [Clostridium sp. KNHs214]|uniref:hypothetical protein n=1 Tax=Clostridium sp. KNHs214 TaxID=1540257 RepID=UPI0005532756|nr:hypothetical protein [Clostridium sp. KNHs214]